MNLHGIVAPAINAVNPSVRAHLKRSIGYTTAPDGKRIPTYAPSISVQCQVQALQYNDIAQLSGLNIQGVRSKIYVSGKVSGLVRQNKQGGDIFVMENGDVYLTAVVLEDWPDWTSVAVTKQDGV